MTLNLYLIIIITIITQGLSSEQLDRNELIDINNKTNLPFQSKHKLNITTDILKGFELAKKVDKPILIVFAGKECRGVIQDGYNEFDKYLITSKKIRKKINNEFITIYLDVDNRTPLKNINTEYMDKIKLSERWRDEIIRRNSVGSLNLYIQIDKFKSNSQPMYVITNSRGEAIIKPFENVGNNQKLFIKKLNEGISKAKK